MHVNQPDRLAILHHENTRDPGLVHMCEHFHGEHIWADNRDERFTASLDTLIGGLQAAQSRPDRVPTI